MSEQLEIASEIEPPETTQPVTAGPSSTQRSFLVVDGSRAVRLTLERMLVSDGATPDDVHFASTGEEAVDVYEEQRPDVAIVGIDLPGAEGHEVTRAILDTDPTARVVVTTVQGPENDERVREAISIGAFDVITKPIRQQKISDLLKLMTDETEGVDRIQ